MWLYSVQCEWPGNSVHSAIEKSIVADNIDQALRSLHEERNTPREDVISIVPVVRVESFSREIRERIRSEELCHPPRE